MNDKTQDLRILFMGRSSGAAQILRNVLEAGFHVPLIVTCPHTSQTEGTPEQFEELARQWKIPFLYCDKFGSGEIEKIRNAKADIGLALFWAWIVDRETTNAVSHGLLNLHGGLLPRYRGNACANWAILNGETEMGITLHFMEPDSIDSGPIVSQRSVPIGRNTVVGDLMTATLQVGGDMIMEVLKRYASGSEPEIQLQDETQAMRCYPRLPEYGNIDWSRSATDIDRHIRSLGPPYDWAYTFIDGTRIEICRAHVLDEPIHEFCAEPGHVIAWFRDGPLWVATGDGVIVIEEVSKDGTDSFPPGTRYRSIRRRLGLNYEREILSLRKRLGNVEAQLKKVGLADSD